MGIMLAVDMSFVTVTSSFDCMIDAFTIVAAVTTIFSFVFLTSFVTGYLQSPFYTEFESSLYFSCSYIFLAEICEAQGLLMARAHFILWYQGSLSNMRLVGSVFAYHLCW